MLEVLIDIRETKLKKHFQSLPFVTIAQLDIGDVIFKYNKEVVVIMERKRIDDLASSIKDGRYKQQKLRLLASYPKDKIIYLIEGDFNHPPNHIIQGLTYYTLTSSMINCLLRDNLKIYKTSTIKETIQFIENFITKLQKQNTSFLKAKTTQENMDDYNNSVIKRNKKKNLTPEVCFLGQLCQIPGISITKANPIVEKYKTMANLIMAYEMSGLTEEEKQLFLSTIEYSQKNNDKIRKLGKKASMKIYQFLF